MSGKCLWSSRCSFLISLVLVSCGPVVAQSADRLGGTWSNPENAAITSTVLENLSRPGEEKTTGVKRASARRRSSTSAAATKVYEASVQFRPTGTQLKTREIANLIDPGNTQVLAILSTILQEYEKGARAAGKPNDLALALSFFLATNASVYHDSGQPTDPQMLELRDTIADALIEGNALKGVTDRQKQEMYETLVLVTGFALAAYQEGKQTGNAQSVRVSQQLAGQSLLAVIGISPDNITFTEQGLNIERGPAVTATPSAPSRSPGTSSATINAGKLVIDFEGNEVRANQLYGGKRIRVNGTVNSIDILRDGRITLTFHSPAGGYAQTRCFFNKSQSSRLAAFSGGQQAIVEGTVRGLGGGLGGRGYVELENCTVP